MRLNHSIWKRALAVILAVSMCGQSVPAVVSAGEVSARKEVSEEGIWKEENENAADMASLQEKEARMRRGTDLLFRTECWQITRAPEGIL